MVQTGLVGGQGVCLLAAGNAPLIALEGVITRPVRGLSPSQLALAWRTGDRRPLVVDYARACRQAARETSFSRGGFLISFCILRRCGQFADDLTQRLAIA